jgi:hypothetical protein
MTREELLAQIWKEARPLGVFGSEEERALESQKWLENVQPEWIDLFVDIFVHPPNYSTHQGKEDLGWYYTTVRALKECATKFPSMFLQKLGAGLSSDGARRWLLRAMAIPNMTDALPLIESLVERVRLSEEDLVTVIGTVREIGGQKARLLLEKTEGTIPSSMATAQREIHNALRDLKSFERQNARPQ